MRKQTDRRDEVEKVPKASDAEPLYFEEFPSPTRKGPLPILLHGRGADEGDLLPIVDYVARGWNAVSIRAPLALFKFHTPRRDGQGAAAGLPDDPVPA